MREEDSEQIICCPYCRATYEVGCEHTLAIVDETFNECHGDLASEQYDEFRTIIEGHFLRLLKSGQREGLSWDDVNVNELWNVVREDYSPQDEELSVDMFAFTNLFIKLLEVAGGKRYPNSLIEGYGPGMTSVIRLFYAEDPARVFEVARSELEARLHKEGR